MNLRTKYEAAYKMLADKNTAKQYKLVYEKDGHIYGSESGIPTKRDVCFTKIDLELKPIVNAPVAPIKLEPIVEEPIIELPVQPKPPVEVKSKRNTRSVAPEVAAVEEPSVEEPSDEEVVEE